MNSKRKAPQASVLSLQRLPSGRRGVWTSLFSSIRIVIYKATEGVLGPLSYFSRDCKEMVQVFFAEVGWPLIALFTFGRTHIVDAVILEDMDFSRGRIVLIYIYQGLWYLIGSLLYTDFLASKAKQKIPRSNCRAIISFERIRVFPWLDCFFDFLVATLRME